MDMRSPYVLSLADLPRQEGSERRVSVHEQAPDGIGVDLMRVPAGTPIDVDLTLQSVKEGVYVHGYVHTHAQGECARCLAPVERDIDEPFDELIYYPHILHSVLDEEDENAEEYLLIENDHIDCEPILRDCLVLSLPLRPLCHPHCRGLCPECGQRLEDLPEGHHHDAVREQTSPLDILEAQLRAQETQSAAESASAQSSAVYEGE